MNKREREILNTTIGDVEPRLTIRSDTRVDAGRWWRRTPLWICVTEEEVVVFAVARRQYIQRIAIADCRDSHYCHTTGELVIETGEDLQFNRLAMSPTDGLRVLEAINADLKSPLEAPTPAARR